MRESVTYQLLLAEGRAEGRVEGRAEAKQETVQEIAIKMLQEGLSPEIVAKVTGLTVDVIQQLQNKEAGN